jgi:hypothetical protein
MYAMSRGSTWANTAKVLDEDLISKADFSKKGHRFLMDKQIFLYIYEPFLPLRANTPSCPSSPPSAHRLSLTLAILEYTPGGPPFPPQILSFSNVHPP